ncbi:putative dimethylaniline monooxygenase [Phaeomoniella chlamydospora]|uniref:Putative dimethylaniline monooxygenase n=1 Tax=Phaeomoniella chlamydospora TaxID=158046 RepID=A0A0G2ELG2_PHACM|nr:putative dimethylaniline monooxygenase [Phaeomoniella chlamydospora]
MRVAVIGGGPSGLLSLKYLKAASDYFPVDPIDVILFESEDALVSSRQFTCFSDFRIPDDKPDFVSTDYYCTYLEQYCKKFGLWPHINLSTTVEKVRRNGEKGHVVTYRKNGSDKSEEYYCDAVAVCSGLHVTPNIPEIPGIEHVPEVLHSSKFKTREQFGVDKNVLVCGSGETSMDVSYLAVTAPTKSVTLSHRSGWQNAPKRFPEPIRFGNVRELKEKVEKYGPSVPTDTLSSSLFDTAYVHPWLEKSFLLWQYYDAFTKYATWLISGTKLGHDQWVGGVPEHRFHASQIIANKSNNAMPYISAPYRPKVQTKADFIRSKYVSLPPFDTKGRQIDLAPWPEYFDENGIVHFQDNGTPEAESMKHATVKPDIVVLATGYRQIFPFLDDTYTVPEHANIRWTWKSGDETVGYIGFVRPAFGAIPPIAELQAQLWVLQILNQLPKPLQQLDYYRLPLTPERRLKYAVDHDTFAYQLALDMNSAPSFLQVLRFGPTVFATWALAPNFNPKFRLVGPWKSPQEAAEVMRTELWRVRDYFKIHHIEMDDMYNAVAPNFLALKYRTIGP